MNYTIKTKNDILLIKLQGDLIGEEIVSELIEEVSGYINQAMILCAIDISKIRFINSSGIGALITILTKFRNKGGEVILIKPSDQVKKLLIITKLNSIFTVVEDEQEAIDQLKNNVIK